MRKWSFSVTYERPESAAPRTVRGVVESGSLRAAAGRAVLAAKKAMPGVRCDSMVLVLERVKPETEDADAV